MASSPSLTVRTLSNIVFSHICDCFIADQAVLAANHRLPLHVATIVSHKPDVLCLYELDFFDVLQKALEPHGYAGVWQPKPNAADGSAIFWRAVDFSLLGHTAEILVNKQSQIAVIANLQRVNSSTGICVAAVHLKAKPGFEDLREKQVRALLSLITAHRHNAFPAIVCGDFNDVPDSLACRAMRDAFTSAYAARWTPDAPWTTWKRRESEVKRTIDYIWCARVLFMFSCA